MHQLTRDTGKINNMMITFYQGINTFQVLKRQNTAKLRAIPKNAITTLKAATFHSRWNFRNKVRAEPMHNILIIMWISDVLYSLLSVCFFATWRYICWKQKSIHFTTTTRKRRHHTQLPSHLPEAHAFYTSKGLHVSWLLCTTKRLATTRVHMASSIKPSNAIQSGGVKSKLKALLVR